MRDEELRALEQTALAGGSAARAQYVRALARVGRRDEALASLLEAIRDAPEDETLRLEHAALLDGHDDARAELVRLQVEAARLSEHDPRRSSLELGAEGLIGRHRERWLQAVVESRTQLAQQKFALGGLEQVFLSASTFARASGELFRVEPLHRARIDASRDTPPRDESPTGESPRDERRVLETCPELRFLRELCVRADPAELERVLASPHLERLTGLTLMRPFVAGKAPRDPLVAIALASAVAPRLRSLEVEAPMSGETLRRILRSRRLTSLRRLRVRVAILGSELAGFLEGSKLKLEELDLGSEKSGPLADEGAAAVAAWPGARSLVRLTMRNHRIWEAGALALAASPHLVRLERLDLLENAIGDNGAHALATSPTLARARLSLDTRKLGPRALEALLERDLGIEHVALEVDEKSARFTTDAFRAFVDSPRAAKLRSLRVNVGAASPAAVVGALAASRHLGGLVSFDLAGETSQPTARGVGALLARAELPGLRALRLVAIGLGPSDLEDLAAWPGLAKLSRLDLSANRFGDAGVAALVPGLGERLEDMRLVDTGLRAPGVRALAGSRAARSTVRLDLSRNVLRSDGAKALALWPADSALRFVDLGGAEIDEAGCASLVAWPRLAELAWLRLEDNPLRGQEPTAGAPAARELGRILGERLVL